MNRLQVIKESFNRGRMNIDDIKFLIDTLDSKNSEIKDYEQSLIRAREEIKELKKGVKK